MICRFHMDLVFEVEASDTVFTHATGVDKCNHHGLECDVIDRNIFWPFGFEIKMVSS